MAMENIYRKISKEEVEAFIEKYPRVKQWLHSKAGQTRIHYPRSRRRRPWNINIHREMARVTEL